MIVRHAGCAGRHRTLAVERSCRDDDRCACATGLAGGGGSHRCFALSLPAQCPLTHVVNNSFVVAAARLRRGTLVATCPTIGPYGATASELLQEIEFTLPGGSSLLPVGPCAAVRLTADAASANVVLELLGNETMLLVAQRAVAAGEELRAVAAPCRTRPLTLRPLSMRAAQHYRAAVRRGGWCPPLEVRRSPLHGRGVFATAGLAAGADVAGVECPVVLGSLHGYTFAHTDASRQLGVNVQVVSLGLCSYVNHACGRPNARWHFDGAAQRLRVVRDVPAGGELLWDYGVDYTGKSKLCWTSANINVLQYHYYNKWWWLWWRWRRWCLLAALGPALMWRLCRECLACMSCLPLA